MALLQKRPMILRSLLIVATPYVHRHIHILHDTIYISSIYTHICMRYPTYMIYKFDSRTHCSSSLRATAPYIQIYIHVYIFIYIYFLTSRHCTLHMYMYIYTCIHIHTLHDSIHILHDSFFSFSPPHIMHDPIYTSSTLYMYMHAIPYTYDVYINLSQGHIL